MLLLAALMSLTLSATSAYLMAGRRFESVLLGTFIFLGFCCAWLVGLSWPEDERFSHQVGAYVCYLLVVLGVTLYNWRSYEQE